MDAKHPLETPGSPATLPTGGGELNRRQVMVFTLSAVTIGLSCLFLLGEVALRLAGRHPSYLDREMYVATGDERGYSLRPGYVGYYAGVPVRVGPLGLRGEAAVQGLLLLGDSALFGQGLNQEQTLSAQFQRRIPALPTTNAGVPGYNTVAELSQLRVLLPRLSPRKVVLVYVVDNDADLRSGVWLRDDGTLDLHVNETLAGGVSRFFTRHLVLYSQLRGLWSIRQQALSAEDRTPFTPDDPGWRRSQGALLAMRDLLRERGIPFGVGGIGLVQNLQAITTVELFCKEQGIPYATLWQTQDVGDFVRRRAVGRTDSHAGAATTGQMADALVTLVSRLQ